MRLNKSAVLLSAVVAALALVGVPLSASGAAPSPFAGKVVKTIVGYNANGDDVEGNRWKEYVQYKNVSAGAVNVDGWFTQDQWAHSNGKTAADDCNVSVFAAATVATDATKFQHLPKDNPDVAGDQPGLWLPAGHSVRVYTGGNADATVDDVHTIALNKPSCGYNGHYLGNGGDTVYLKDKDGNVVDRFSYSFEHGYWVR